MIDDSTDDTRPPALPIGFRHMPENVESEQALLGAILVNNEAYHRVSSFLRAEHFYEPVHRRIFAAMSRVIEEGRLAGALTLKSEFDEDEALRELDGGRYLRGLARAAETILNAEDYGILVAELAAKRAMIRVGEEMVNRLYDPQCPDRASAVSSKAASDLEAIANDTAAPEIMSGVEVFRKLLDAVSAGDATISTGFTSLDDALGGGFRIGGLYAIEGRDKAFKSGFCAGIFEAASLRGDVPSLYVTLEISPADIMQRLGAGHAGIGFRSFENDCQRAAKSEQLIQFDKLLEERRQRFLLAHKPGIDIRGLLGLMSQAVAKHDVTLIVVDYWQLISGCEHGQTQAAHLENVANAIAEFARKSDVVVFMASQLNRQDESLGSDGLRRSCS